MHSKIIAALSGQFIIFSSIYTLVFVVVLLDLWSGIRKAKRRGEFRSSYGLRRTVEKMAKYFNMLMLLTVIDIMQIIAIGHLNPQITFSIPLLPALTVLGAIFVGVIEFKSIYEKAEDKDKGQYQDAMRFTRKIVQDADNKALLSRVMEYLKTENTKKDGTDR